MFILGIRGFMANKLKKKSKNIFFYFLKLLYMDELDIVGKRRTFTIHSSYQKQLSAEICFSRGMVKTVTFLLRIIFCSRECVVCCIWRNLLYLPRAVYTKMDRKANNNNNNKDKNDVNLNFLE